MKRRRELAGEDASRTAAQLQQTQQTAARGLGLFLESLEKSHFREAVDSYQQLQWVILAQREWACMHRRFDLDEGWATIATQAQALHELFSGMAAALEPLRWIDGRPPRSSSTAPAERKLAEWIAAALKEAVLTPDADDLALAEELVRREVLIRRPRSRRPSFRLAAAPRARLAQAASALVPQPR